MNAPPETVLILEDDPGVARLQRLRLERAGYTVVAVTTPAEALARLRVGEVDLLVLDNRLDGGEEGLGFYTRLKADGWDDYVPALLDRNELPLHRALPMSPKQRLIREVVLQLKTGRLDAASQQRPFDTESRVDGSSR